MRFISNKFTLVSYQYKDKILISNQHYIKFLSFAKMPKAKKFLGDFPNINTFEIKNFSCIGGHAHLSVDFATRRKKNHAKKPFKTSLIKTHIIYENLQLSHKM